MKTGKQLIKEERLRQVTAEGYSPKHDDQHDNQQLQRAAESYYLSASMHAVGFQSFHPPDGWPWEKEWWKPSNPVRDLTKAGALWLAEIDRMKRLSAEMKFPTILQNLRNRVNDCARKIDALLVVKG